MAAKKLSKKALNKSFWLWFHGHLTCFTYEHMQTFGYMCSMLPLIEELYDSKESNRKHFTKRWVKSSVWFCDWISVFHHKRTKV